MTPEEAAAAVAAEKYKGPMPVVDERPESWKVRGNCLGDGSDRARKIAAEEGYATVLDAMFPERGQSLTAARRICATCPVAKDCLDYALVNPAEQGVWGGSSYRQRKLIRSSDNTERAVDKHLAELRSPQPPPRSWGEPAPCGTTSGYRRHRRHKEDPCADCREAERISSREIARKRAAARRAAAKEAAGE